MNASVLALGKIFYSQEPVSEQQLSSLFDAIVVPGDICWRAVFQMIFDPGFKAYLGAGQENSRQKMEQVMHQALHIAKRSAYSKTVLLDLIKECNMASVSVCQNELSDALNDLDELARKKSDSKQRHQTANKDSWFRRASTC